MREIFIQDVHHINKPEISHAVC